MPEPREINDPYGLDHLPRPNLSLESITHRADSVRRPTVKDRYLAKESPTQVTHSENEPKAKTDMVTSTTENESKRTEKKVHRSWAFVSPKTNDNYGTQETQGIAENSPAPSMNKGTPITESNLHIVSSQDSGKPTIVTSKRPYDYSFSSNPLWRIKKTEATSTAVPTTLRPINAHVATHALSNDASITTSTSSTQAPNASPSRTTLSRVSQNSVSTSKSSTTKSTTSKTSSPTPTSNQSSSTTSSSSSSINQQSSTTNSPRSQGNRQRSSRNSSSSTSHSSSSSSNTNRRRRRQREQSPEICWSEDVDNFMGCKSINELVKFIEG